MSLKFGNKGGFIRSFQIHISNQSLSTKICYITIASIALIILYLKINGAEITVNVEYKPNNSLDTAEIFERLSNLAAIETREHKDELVANRPRLVPNPPTWETIKYDSLLSVLEKWSPDDPEIPSDFKETIQNFNFGDPYERSLAEKYRDAEVPFKIHNVSEFDEITKKWSDEYLIRETNKMRHKGAVEMSKNNHFLFWQNKAINNIEGYKPPSEIIHDMDFEEWVQLAHESVEKKWDQHTKHYYFYVNANSQNRFNNFAGRDLWMFTTKKPNFFITNVEAMSGINCRFGMRGIIAESHYDLGKNMVAMIRGNKRYIISPPSECPYFAVVNELKHPSYRQSIIDWSDMNQAKSHNFDKVKALDTIVHEGEVLYIPSYWFHYIVSLDYSIQCNARSGVPYDLAGKKDIDDCLGSVSRPPGPHMIAKKKREY